MNRKIFQPSGLTTRQMTELINFSNNSLKFTPNGIEAFKVTDLKIIGLLE
jgi:hypothetical protein